VAGFGNAEELRLLDLSVPVATDHKIGLHTADPGEDGTASEVSAAGGTAYGRATCQFAAAAAEAGLGVQRNSTVATFAEAGAAWGDITHFSVWTNAGVYRGSGTIRDGAGNPVTRTVGTGVQPSFAVGDLALTLD
jgi:hypothetical protein